MGWRPTQGSLEMEFMFGDMDDEFMAELTRESTPASEEDEDVVMAGADVEYRPLTTAWGVGQERGVGLGGRVVDEDYD